ncbi:MAG: sensor domain-containing diguanylate cyclase [Sulfuriferula sp.]
MMPEPPHDKTDYELHQKLLAVYKLTLADIAQRAPLAQTLTGIVTGIEDPNPGIHGAIFLMDEEGNRLHLATAPSLPENYLRAIDSITVSDEVWACQSATDNAILITAERIEASQFWCNFCELAKQHALQACMAIPILSAGNRVLGIFVAYSQGIGQMNSRHREIITDIALLASIAIERNIDEAKLNGAENTLRESETRMALAIKESGTGIWDRNIVTGEMHYSSGWKAILGYTDEEISNRIEDSYTRVHPDDLDAVQAAIQAHFDQKTNGYAVEHRIRCKDGSYKWISSRGRVVSRDREGKPLRMIGTTTDITSLRALSERLQQSVDLLTDLTNEIPGLVFQYRLLPNGDAFFPYASQGIKDIYETTPERVMRSASAVQQVIHPDDLENYRASFNESAASLTPWHLEYRVILPRQRLRWRQGHARPIRLQDGSTLWHGFIADVTERKHIEIELQEFATIDFLTQLPNRRYFMARMDEELVQIKRMADPYSAVLMCDLDLFKTINDNYGHAVGDLVLKHFARILRDELRMNDTVGRVGGEEFAVVLSGMGTPEANIFANRVQKRLAETPLVVSDVTITVTTSIGITVMKATDMNADASLSRSDKALYRAKTGGRNRIEIFVD